MNKSIIAMASALFLLTSSAFALQINPTLGQDILSSKDISLSVSYKFFHVLNNEIKTEAIDMQGLPISRFMQYFDAFNRDYAALIPTDSIDGTHSTITFGYFEGNKSIYPASCSLIKIQPVMNVVINKEGCLVS